MRLKRFIKQYSGSSFPTLIETEGGGEYILKMRGSGNGSLSLLSEFIANSVTSQLGWPVPSVEWVSIPENFPWTFGTDEFDDIVQKSYGWNLGIEYIRDARQLRAKDIDLSDNILLNSIYTLDVFFINVDRTDSSCNLLTDFENRTWLIDHGSLALFHGLEKCGYGLFDNHILHDVIKTAIMNYRMDLHNVNLFQKAIELVPDSILVGSKFSKRSLLELIKARIEKFDLG